MNKYSGQFPNRPRNLPSTQLAMCFQILVQKIILIHCISLNAQAKCDDDIMLTPNHMDNKRFRTENAGHFRTKLNFLNYNRVRIKKNV